MNIVHHLPTPRPPRPVAARDIPGLSLCISDGMARRQSGNGNSGQRAQSQSTQNQNKPNNQNRQKNQNGQGDQNKPFCKTCHLHHTGQCAPAYCNTCKNTHRPPCFFAKGDTTNGQSNSAANNTQGQKIDPNKFCSTCLNPGHTSKDCRLNRPNDKRKKSSTDVSMTGMDSNVLYCQICNRNGHDHTTCQNLTQENLLVALQSKRVCWKCENRGHTADECQRTTSPGCSVCRTLSHTIDSCPRATKGQKDIIRQSQVRTGTPAQVFAFNPANKRLMEEAQRAERARQAASVPTNSSTFQPFRMPPPSRRPLQAPRLALTTYGLPGRYPQSEALSTAILKMPTPAGFSQDKRELWHKQKALVLEAKRDELDLAIARRIDRAHKDYKKDMISHYFIRPDCRQAILENSLLSRERLDEAGRSVLNGEFFYFRDPKAIEAIAKRKRPICRFCGGEGAICDRYLNLLPIDQNVLSVEDGYEWGITIVMRCHCSVTNGYRFMKNVDRVFDNEGRFDAERFVALTPRTLATAAKKVDVWADARI